MTARLFDEEGSVPLEFGEGKSEGFFPPGDPVKGLSNLLRTSLLPGS